MEVNKNIIKNNKLNIKLFPSNIKITEYFYYYYKIGSYNDKILYFANK